MRNAAKAAGRNPEANVNLTGGAGLLQRLRQQNVAPAAPQVAPTLGRR